MSERDLQRQLDLLRQRIECLEQALHVTPLDDAQDPRFPQPSTRETGPASQDVGPPLLTPLAQPAPEAACPVSVPPSPPPSHLPSSMSLASTLAERKGPGPEEKHPLLSATALSPPSTNPPTQSAYPPTAHPPTAPAGKLPAPHDTRSGSGLEMLLGGKAAAWIGALVIVIGAGFLVKLGIDAGWWGHLSPLTRCLLIAAFGGSLVVTGEMALRQISRAASVGLFGAGLGVLYLDAFATFRFFDLLGEGGSFLLMGLVALIGFGITLRTRFRTIGVLSLISGYLTPILLRGAGGHDLELLTYLTALFGIALALSAIDARHFRTLRYLALGGQAFVAFGWLVTQGSTHWMPAIIFMSIWWTMLLFETVLAAVREQSPRGNPVAVLLATAAYVTATCWILNGAAPSGSLWLGAFTVAIAVLGAAAALHLTGFDALRKRPKDPVSKLAVALWLQSGALLVIAAALQFDGYGQSISWLMIALAAVEIGRRLPSRGVDLFGVIVGVLAALRVLVVDRWAQPALAQTLWEWGTVTINGWGILMVLTSLTAHVAAQRIRPVWSSGDGRRVSRFWTSMPFNLALAGTGFWLLSCEAQADGLTVTAGWLLAPIALIALSAAGLRQRYLQIALLALVVIAARWLIVDALAARLAPSWSSADQLPLFNGQMGLALAIAGVGAAAVLRLSGQERALSAAMPGVPGSEPAAERSITGSLFAGHVPQLLIIITTIFTLIAISFEIDRLVVGLAVSQQPVTWSIGHVRQLSLTILWTFGSLALGVMARVLVRSAGDTLGASPLVMRLAWTLLSLCAMKWIVVDTFYWTVVAERAAALSLTQMLNVQMFAALVLAGSLAALAALTCPAPEGATEQESGRGSEDLSAMVRIAPAAIAVVILWALSFEMDRAAEVFDLQAMRALAFDRPLLRGLSWICLWSTGGAVMLALAHRKRMAPLLPAGWAVIVGSAVVWLSWATLTWRLMEGMSTVPVIFNLQFAAGVVAAICTGLGVFLWRRETDDDRWSPWRGQIRALGMGIIALIGLWLGSLEIDRALAGDGTAVHAGLSVYWAIYGVMLVSLGFAKRIPAVRYAGLALLAITVSKVLLVDLRTLETIWRVVSFLVSGLLLVGTSVLYTRLSPRVVREG